MSVSVEKPGKYEISYCSNGFTTVLPDDRKISGFIVAQPNHFLSLSWDTHSLAESKLLMESGMITGYVYVAPKRER